MMNIIDKEPINKLAKIVTNQKGCSDGNLNNEQIRQNLVQKVKILTERIKYFPKSSCERKKIGSEISEINKQINSIRPKAKCKSVDNYFIDAARKILTSEMFRMVMNEAAVMAHNDGHESIIVKNGLNKAI
jgi:hypothetical protein